MDVLLAYHSAWNQVGYSFESIFEKNGARVERVFFEKSPFWTDVRGILPFYFPKGRPLSLAAMEEKRGSAFDLVLEIDGTGQHHLSGLSATSAVRMLWSCDINRPDKQKLHRWMEKDFDLILVALKSYLSFFKKERLWLPYACDPAVHKKFDLPKICDIVFVGNLDPKIYPERVRLIEVLSGKFKVKTVSGLYGEEASRIYSQAKIVFNLGHFGEINMRVFEALACGSLLLTNRLPAETGLSELFSDGKHLAYYGDEKELLDKAAYYLAHEAERESAAALGREEVLAKHTYEHRAAAILEIARQRTGGMKR